MIFKSTSLCIFVGKKSLNFPNTLHYLFMFTPNMSFNIEPNNTPIVFIKR